MIKGKRVLAVILARGGSKGIKKKNIYNICDHPLISYTIYAAKKSKLIDQLVVSTDSKIISKICNQYQADTPFLRPKKLAKDKVWSRDALKHAVIASEKIFNCKYDIVIELPATGPMRPSYEIDRALEKLVKTKCTSVIGVSRIFDKHPIRIKKIQNDKIIDYNKTLKEGEGSRRQALPPCYARNGSIYAMTRETIIKKFSRIGSISRPIIMKSIHSINIDEYEDIYLFETLVKKGFCENRPAEIFLDKKINIFNKNKNKTILISYNEKLSKKISLKILKNFKVIFCDQKNIESIKNKNEIIGWVCSTQGIVKIDKKILNLFPNLRILCSPSTGLTHLNLDDLNKKKIKIIYLNNIKYNLKIKSSSEFTIALLLSVIRKIPLANTKVLNNNWRNLENKVRAHELSYYQFGIFGFGRIGKNVFKFLKNHTKKINYYDPYISNSMCKRIKNLDQFLKKTNFLIICSSLNKDNKKIFDYKKILKLKEGTIIINTSRGELIDEDAMINLIKKKHISQYATDVLSNEDKILSRKNKLVQFSRKNPNILITPHIAGLSYESELKAINFVLKKIKSYL